MLIFRSQNQHLIKTKKHCKKIETKMTTWQPRPIIEFSFKQKKLINYEKYMIHPTCLLFVIYRLFLLVLVLFRIYSYKCTDMRLCASTRKLRMPIEVNVERTFSLLSFWSSSCVNLYAVHTKYERTHVCCVRIFWCAFFVYCCELYLYTSKK